MPDATRAGFSADTEVLTRAGWKPVTQATEDDEIATRSPEGVFLWREPERAWMAPADGDLVHLSSRNTNLLVTPQTPVLYLHRLRRGGPDGSDAYPERAIPAAMAVGKRLSLVGTSRWLPEGAPTSIFMKAERGTTYGGRGANYGHDFSASSADFAAFMGMYLAEGTLSAVHAPGHYVTIWQTTQGKGFAEYQDLLNRILGRELPWMASKGSWSFSHKALCAYLRLCGGYAWTKAVPSEVLDLPAADLERFWRFYWLGDGTPMVWEGRKPLEVISTTSPVMAGQIQEVLQKLGGWSMIQVVDFTKYLPKSGIGAKTARTVYRLVRRASPVAFTSTICPLPWGGADVGYLDAGDSAIYVRRNFRPVWAGGSLR